MKIFLSAILVCAVSAAPTVPTLFVNETASPVTIPARTYHYFGPQIDTAPNQPSEVCARSWGSSIGNDDISETEINKCILNPGVPPYSKDSYDYGFLKTDQIWWHQWDDPAVGCDMNTTHKDYFLGNLNACTADQVGVGVCDCDEVQGYLKAFPKNDCGAVYVPHSKFERGHCHCGSVNGKPCGPIVANWWGKNPPATPINCDKTPHLRAHCGGD